MSDNAKEIEKVFLLALIALLIIGSIMILLPFLRAILWAMVFAVTIWPYFIKLEKALRGRTGLAAVISTLVLALVFFLPMVYVGYKLASQASVAIDYTEELMEKGLGPSPSWLKDLPLVGEKLGGIWQTLGQDTPKLIEMVKPHIKILLGSIVSAGTGMAQVILITVLSLILFLLVVKEGHPIRTSLLRMAVRLGGEKGRRLLMVAGSTMRSVVFGILIAALIQGIMAIFGLWISGVPNPVLIGAVAGVFALIPIGLIQLVLLPAAGWLIFFKGQIGWGIFLAIWSFTVIGNIDNFVRPMFISRGANVPFLVILLGVLGGLATGGIIGLFVGATLLAVVYTMLKEWLAESGENSSAA